MTSCRWPDCAEPGGRGGASLLVVLAGLFRFCSVGESGCGLSSGQLDSDLDCGGGGGCFVEVEAEADVCVEDLAGSLLD